MNVSTIAFSAALTLAAAEVNAQCYEIVDVFCPIRSEVTLSVGPSTEKLAVSGAWTATKRVGLYARIFPGLDPRVRPRENATVTAQSASEFGVTYRLRTPLTVGVGYGKFKEAVRSFGANDPFTFLPTLIDESTLLRSGPSVFVAYAFAPPKRPIGLAITLSAGVIGSGVSIGTTLRFPKGGATPGVK